LHGLKRVVHRRLVVVLCSIEEENKSFAKVQRLKAPRREAGAPADE
jgi:hypothetical protein